MRININLPPGIDITNLLPTLQMALPIMINRVQDHATYRNSGWQRSSRNVNLGTAGLVLDVVFTGTDRGVCRDHQATPITNPIINTPKAPHFFISTATLNFKLDSASLWFICQLTDGLIKIL